MFIIPDGWTQFSPPIADTLIPAGDSIFLSLRARIPSSASSEDEYQVFFRAYGVKNELVTESSFIVYPEIYHDWNFIIEKDRLFFSPADNSSDFRIVLSNKGNIRENVKLVIVPDKKVKMEDQSEWAEGKELNLPPFQDTVIRINVTYNSDEERVFDMGRISVTSINGDEKKQRSIMIEKYSDVYSPLYINRKLPHTVEFGFRTFTNNKDVLPFLKARGSTTFKHGSSFMYNFNFYSITKNENFLSNSYYNFLYQWRDLKVGLGAFSSQLGRNLYTRNGVMVSNVVRLTPAFSLEAFISQSIFVSKTSAAVGYNLETKKININGSFSYDRDAEKGLNTISGIFRAENIKLFKTHQVNISLYGYQESHYQTINYSLAGIAYDLSYFGRIGKSFTFQILNNYGSPDIPGPQMGLFQTSLNATYAVDQRIRYFSLKYIYATRNYYNIAFDGTRMPNNNLYDQYFNISFHSGLNPNHVWEAGPSYETYHSYRPSQVEGQIQYFSSQKIRIEYKSNVLKDISLNIKAGITDNAIKDVDTASERKYDFHFQGGYNFMGDYSLSLNYDYGPMVNNGLYQYASDALNHSIAVGPSMSSTYFNDRVHLSVFANYTYRIDLKNMGFNVNPKVETYLARDWYFVVSGTYHFSRQEYRNQMVSKSYAYAEFSLKKMWGKSEFDKWQKDTRKVKIIFFKDDNSNGIKDYGEEGVPYVKTRMKLTNSATSNVSTQFPIDVVLLSNEEGVVIFNRMPVGFYELTIIPLGDVREYFYVEKGSEKLEVTKVSVFYIPFQKASRLTGKIDLKRTQFIKQGDEGISLENIRITAYNKTGNSYSSFTLKDGSFTIFVPGENEYYVRMPNVFGDKFKILKNDILTYVSDTSASNVVFNVSESTRQISFKKAKPAEPDTANQPLKIKVLHGKMFENPAYDSVDVNAPPQFNMQLAPPAEQILKPGTIYAVAAGEMEKEDAVNLYRILDENGITCSLGLDQNTGKYYVYTRSYTVEKEAKAEVEKLKMAGVRDAKVLKY